MSFAQQLQKSLNRWFRIFMILLAVMTIFSTASFGVLMGYIKNLPPIEELENYQPKQKTLIYERTGQQQVGNFTSDEGNRELVKIRDCPAQLANAFIAIEDRRFHQHFGIDLRSFLRALKKNIQTKSFTEGFSTITLQLPRNILPDQVSREKKIARKLKESLLALQIEKRYSKDQILEFYLNQIYLGNLSFGVVSAARNYFDKDLDELTLAESALIAGLPQLPTKYNPWINEDAARGRRNDVLDAMLGEGMIDEAEWQQARDESIELHRPKSTYRTAPYFVEHLRREMVRDPAFNNADLHQRGYAIRSTLDLGLQTIVDEELRAGLSRVEEVNGLKGAEAAWQNIKPDRFVNYEVKKWQDTTLASGQARLGKIVDIEDGLLKVRIPDRAAGLDYNGEVILPDKLPYFHPENTIKITNLSYIDVLVTDVDKRTATFQGELYDKTHIQGAVVILDASNGDVLAMSGGADFWDTVNNGQWNRAVQSARQPGSCLKPFYYAYALTKDLSPGTIIIDESFAIGNYAPRNFEDTFFGPTTLRECLEHSRNVPTVMLYELILGREPANRFVRKFDFIPDVRPWLLRAEAPTCLGNTNINLLELCAAYVPFINQGIGFRPRSVSRIDYADNGILAKEFKADENSVLSAANAYLMTSMLQGVMIDGTGKLNIHRHLKDLPGAPEMAGKTGTTNDCVDAWFMGYTPQLVVGVWVGFDSVRTMGPNMTGSRTAGPIWTAIVKRIIEEQPVWTATKSFTVPDDIIYCDIDRTTGLLASTVTPSQFIMKNVAFLKGTEPIDVTPKLPEDYIINPPGEH